ncbi:MAG: diacylglycerol kinase family protein [Clostridia bacterium]
MSNIIRSFKNAIRGLFIAYKEERNLKIHFMISILVLLFAIFFNISNLELTLLLLVIMVVIAMEMLNTALERILDIISPKYNNNVGKIKDVAAGSVLVCAFIAAIIGILIFTPYVYERLGR